MSASTGYDYVALDPKGRRVRGHLGAASQEAAHARLVRDGMAPLRLRSASSRRPLGAKRAGVNGRALAEFLFDLSVLVDAGASLRASLAIVGSRSGNVRIERLAKQIETEISAGGTVEQAFAKSLGQHASVVPGLVAAGEASGRLAGSLKSAADGIETNLDISEKLVGAVSYPIFLLLLSAASIVVLLLFVVPSLEPLLDQSDQTPPLIMRVMIATSHGLQAFGAEIVMGLAGVAVGTVAAWRLGLLAKTWEVWLLDGPLRGVSRGFVFGQFCTVLGQLLQAGVAATTAVRIAATSTRLSIARARLATMLAEIQQGSRVSEALASCRGVPAGVVRMAAIGEESGALGMMIERSGRIEQGRALRLMKSLTQWLGPVLIVAMGLMVGGTMAGLLSSLTSLGDSALAN